jgi:hypothetical protein
LWIWWSQMQFFWRREAKPVKRMFATVKSTIDTDNSSNTVLLFLFLWNSPNMYTRAHHTCKKQGDLTSRSETMRETSNSVIETCFRKNMFFFHIFFLNLHLKCVFANILLISFIFKNKFMFFICFIIIIDLIFVDFRFYSFLSWNL